MAEYNGISNAASGSFTFRAGHKTLIIGSASAWGSCTIAAENSDGGFVTLDNGSKVADFASTFDQVPKDAIIQVTVAGATDAYVRAVTQDIVQN